MRAHEVAQLYGRDGDPSYPWTGRCTVCGTEAKLALRLAAGEIIDGEVQNEIWVSRMMSTTPCSPPPPMPLSARERARRKPRAEL